MLTMNLRVRATGIGNIASITCTEGKHFLVRGVTSRGLFLEDEIANILFLSYEKYRGPYTLNIPTEAGERSGESIPGITEAVYLDGVLHFYANNLEIVVDPKISWTPALFEGLPDKIKLDISNKVEQLKQIPGSPESLLAIVQSIASSHFLILS